MLHINHHFQINNCELKLYHLTTFRSYAPTIFPSLSANCWSWIQTHAGERGLLWVAFRFPPKGPREFFDSFGNCLEYYHKRFQNILIFNGPRYKNVDSRIQSETSTVWTLLYIFHITKVVVYGTQKHLTSWLGWFVVTCTSGG